MRRAGAAALMLAVLGATSWGVLDARAAVDRRGTVVTTLTLFAGTSEGLWRSGDWGSTWERVYGRTSGVRLDVLGGVRAIVPRGPQVWAAGDGGLFVSEDFGETWAPLSVTEGISSLLLSRWPEADPTVFVATAEGLLRSRDAGRTFSPTSLAGTAIHRLEWPGPALVVACDRGLLITTDEGGHFEGPGAGLPEGPVLAMALSSYFATDPVLFAAPASGGVFRSGDRGKTYRSAGLEGERVFDLVWLGIIVVLLTMIGQVTPPVAIVVYAVSGMAPDIPMGDIFKRVGVLWMSEVLVIVIITFIPSIVLFLPNLLK